MKRIYDIEEDDDMEYVGNVGGVQRIEPIAETSLILGDVLSELSHEDFILITLYYEYGFNQEEIASIQNTSTNSVSRRLGLTLRYLRARLVEEGLFHV